VNLYATYLHSNPASPINLRQYIAGFLTCIKNFIHGLLPASGSFLTDGNACLRDFSVDKFSRNLLTQGSYLLDKKVEMAPLRASSGAVVFLHIAQQE